jgi:aryl-alcohol dehydrogenase-like predicted oxidoreductase
MKIISFYRNEPVYDKVKKLAGLADGWGMELNQMVFSYMLSLRGMGPVIPSSSTVKQLESNAAAAALVLNNDQKRLIEEVINT